MSQMIFAIVKICKTLLDIHHLRNMRTAMRILGFYLNSANVAGG